VDVCDEEKKKAARPTVRVLIFLLMQAVGARNEMFYCDENTTGRVRTQECKFIGESVVTAKILIMSQPCLDKVPR
jgi:hypothetical protein